MKKQSKVFRKVKIIVLRLKNKGYNLLKFILLGLTDVLKKWFTFLNNYSKHRRWTSAIFLVSVLLSVLILWKIYAIYSLSSVPTGITLTSTGEKYEINDVKILITYNPNGEDSLETSVSFKTSAIKNQETKEQDSIKKESFEQFLISVSPNLRPANDFFSQGLDKNECFSGDTKCYHFTDSNYHELRETFYGNMFGHSSQGEFFDLNVYVAKNGAIKSVPVTIVIVNVSDLSISTLYPEPKDKSLNVLKYNFEKDEKMLSIPSIRLTAINQNKSISSQFELVILGTIFGISASFITTILFEAVKDYETDGNKP